MIKWEEVTEKCSLALLVFNISGVSKRTSYCKYFMNINEVVGTVNL